jgi:NAD(P)-dependent dehydrogenase (short-subunit alcohol dehydrogenase family)
MSADPVNDPMGADPTSGHPAGGDPVGGERRRMRPPPGPALPSSLPNDPARPLLGGRLAVVTGAAHGIGAGIAKALAYHGAAVVLVDNDEAGAAATAAGIARWRRGAEPVVVAVDVTDSIAATRVRAAADAAGGADILVNNVGDWRPSGPFLSSAEPDWERAHQLNFLHVLRMTRELLPGMVRRRGGAVLNVSSVEGMRGIPGNAVYGAMKAAVIGFTASLAAEVGQYSIRVNCLAPDLTDTVQTPVWSATDERYADHVGKWLPVGRFGHPADHGDAALFLVSDQSRFITGVTLRVDGGTLAAPGWLRRDETRFTNLPRPLR